MPDHTTGNSGKFFSTGPEFTGTELQVRNKKMTKCAAMTFPGRVYSRSSTPSSQPGPPGEAEIHQLNCQRKRKVRKKTGWKCLEPGSLNLCVGNDVVAQIAKMRSLICERPEEIKYPPGWEHIPECRGGYRYYSAAAMAGHETQEVLVRTGATNPLPNCVELFAEVNLRKRFGLRDGDKIRVTVR